MLKNINRVLKDIWKWQKSIFSLEMLYVLSSVLSMYAVSFLLKVVLDQVQNRREMKEFTLFVIIYTLILGVIYILRVFSEEKMKWKFFYIRNKYLLLMLNKMLNIDYKKLEDPQIMNLHSKIKNDLYCQNRGIHGIIISLSNFFVFLIQVMVLAIIIGKVDYKLIIIISLFTILQFIPVQKTKKEDQAKVWKALGAAWKKIYYLNRTTSDYKYAKDIRIFKMQRLIYNKQKDVCEEIHNKFLESAKLWIVCHSKLKALALIGNGVVYLFLIYFYVNGRMSIGDFVLYTSLAKEFAQALNRLMWEYANISQNSDDITDFFEFLNIREEKVKSDKNSISISEVLMRKNTIRFENVYFRYNEKESFVLSDINFSITTGDKLAVVGLNGAGKSTLIKLMLRLYEPSRGSIYLNSVNVNRINKKEYFCFFAPIFQDYCVYPFSVAENIGMQQKKFLDMGRIKRVLQETSLYQKIDLLENTVNTKMTKIFSSEGIDLSGGEEQKLALSRAIYKDAELIILDEPTAALDSVSENNLYKKMKCLSKQKMCIFITHRLASTRFCDRILLIENGRITESGTHSNLIANKGVYANLFDVQSRYYN